ncbi:uncharacterized protein LOC107271207 isoform X2 [Cephus cinctus]|uniref:Uncharacterized protein LOC107271207 isoform X2 n=1 Tax=Cephus cinctus TaxID=211228 RepID=A0AAJ7C5H5_CEPCN|nr:uncharacterized protein LOC107271207 isoform X2 [Cephus cinctus]
MVKKRGIVWNYYIKKVDGSQVIAFCKFCDQSYIQNATRMERHMERCPKCPEDIRQQFIQVAHNKKNKTNVLGIKINDTWTKQESSMEQSNITDTELEDLDDWGYRNQAYPDGTTSSMQQNMELVMQTGDQSWENRDSTIQPTESDTNTVNRNWEANRSAAEPAASAASQERGGSVHQRKSHAPRRISQWPLLSMRSSGYSPLQSKIYQEQLLEQRALRRAAELELRRKTLEFERFQWEYERDKAHSELRWAHESRMMQFKEERERQIIEENRTRGLSHVITERQRSLRFF